MGDKSAPNRSAPVVEDDEQIAHILRCILVALWRPEGRAHSASGTGGRWVEITRTARRGKRH